MGKPSWIALGYWEYERLSSSPRREDRLRAYADDHSAARAKRAVLELAQAGDRDVIPMLEQIASLASNDDALLYLGAGELEDLLHESDDETFVAAIEAVCGSRKLRVALRGVSTDELSQHRKAQIERVLEARRTDSRATGSTVSDERERSYRPEL